MIKACIYLRVSSSKQVEEGDSIPAHRSALMDYISSHSNMVFAGEYLDDGITGTRNDRDEFQRMLSDVKNGRINLILVTKMDRLHRSLRNFLNMQDVLDRYHCDWRAIWEPMYDTSTPQGRMIINTMMNLAQFEAENTGQRIRQVQAYKVSKGEVISGSTPPGYSIVNKELVPDKSASAVKDVFQYYSMSGSLHKTIRYAEQFQIFPRSDSAFKTLLKNKKYIGVFRDNENFCEPIISKDLFYDVQRKLSMNVKKSQKRTYVFSSLIKCAYCGNVMGGYTKIRKRTGEYEEKAYRCAKRYNGGIRRCSNTKTITESTLEKYMLSILRPSIENIVLQYEHKSGQKDVSSNTSALEKKITRLKELYVNDMISLEEYIRDRKEYEEQITELKKVHTAPPKQISSLLDTDIESLYKTFTDEQKRFFWRSIVREIRFTDFRHMEVIFFE